MEGTLGDAKGHGGGLLAKLSRRRDKTGVWYENPKVVLLKTPLQNHDKRMRALPRNPVHLYPSESTPGRTEEKKSVPIPTNLLLRI